MAMLKLLGGLCFSAMLLLQGCGGGGGGSSLTSGDTFTGVTTQARIDEANAQELSMAATSGAQQAVAGDLSGDLVMLRPAAQQDPRLLALSSRFVAWFSSHNDQYQARTTVDFSAEFCTSGGSASVSVNDAETDFIMTFSNCASADAGEIMMLNGSVHMATNTDRTQFTIVYESFTITVGDFSETINMTVSCTDDLGTISCSYSADFAGIDGRTYRVEDMSFSGDEFSGYSVSGRVYDPDYGYIDITTEVPVTYDCANGSPSAGRIVFTGAEGTSASIEFVSCSQYLVTVNGVADPLYDW